MHVLIVGGSRADRLRAAVAVSSARTAATVMLEAATLPFVRSSGGENPAEAGSHSRVRAASARVVRIDDIERAFPNTQATGTRLVLTQSLYRLQALIDRLAPDDVVVATGDRDALERNAPEAFERRGVWRVFDILTTEDAEDTEEQSGNQRSEARVNERLSSADRDLDLSSVSSVSSVVDLLVRAFQTGSPDERLALCRRAADAAPDSAVAALTLASALRERQDLAGAHAALDRALALAPEWEAAHFEAGKFWLGCEQMARARDAFRRAADLMPSFSAAFSNLGATLGELDDPEGAAAAFAQALAFDPESVTILNNVGVVNRELGRFDVSEEALLRVTRMAPAFVFGHYNLGHTRFLAGNYAGALDAYEEGRRRDPERNRRQGCRLALVRFATGDIAGAERDFWPCADAAPPEEREDLLLEALEIAQALVQTHPALAAHRQFLERITAALTV